MTLKCFATVRSINIRVIIIEIVSSKYEMLPTNNIVRRSKLICTFLPPELAIGSGISGGIYDYFWLNDLVGTFWEVAFTSVNLAPLEPILSVNLNIRIVATPILSGRRLSNVRGWPERCLVRLEVRSHHRSQSAMTTSAQKVG